jgi:hypothetical protein
MEVPERAKKSSPPGESAADLESLISQGFPGRWLIDFHSKDSFTIRKFE